MQILVIVANIQWGVSVKGPCERADRRPGPWGPFGNSVDPGQGKQATYVLGDLCGTGFRVNCNGTRVSRS